MNPLTLVVWLLGAAPPAIPPLGGPEVVAVRAQVAQGATRLLVETSVPVEASLTRVDDGFLLVLPARLDPGLRLPEPPSPLRGLRREDDPRGATLRLQVRPDVGASLRTEGTRLVISFSGHPPAPPAPRPVSELYPLLFPARPEPPSVVTDTGAAPAESGEGYRLGPARLRVGLDGDYVDATSTVTDAPVPVRDRYFEVRPLARMDLPLSGGQVQAAYDPVFRWGGQIAASNTTSQLFTVNAEHDLGARTQVRGEWRRAMGVLETIEVDPGQEYFYGLDHYTHDTFAVGLKLKGGGRLDAEGTLNWHQVRVDPQSSFFSYDRGAWEAHLGYELTPRVRLQAGYRQDRVPPPEQRPLAEARGRGLVLTVEGDLGPLTTASIAVGYTWRDAPQAVAAARHYDGVVAQATIRRQLGESSNLTLGVMRGVFPSGFENDAYYVGSGAELLASTTRLPLGLSLHAGARYHENSYRVPAVEVSEPRKDRITGWSVGLGYSLARWAFLRADYNQDRRQSNLPGFSLRTHSFSATIGLRPLRASAEAPPRATY